MDTYYVNSKNYPMKGHKLCLAGTSDYRRSSLMKLA